MFRKLAVMRRNLHIRKSPKVADESVVLRVGGGDGAELPIVHEIHTRPRGGGGWIAFSIIYRVVRAPLSIISCLSQPHVSGADGVWVSGGEFAEVSEMNHIMPTSVFLDSEAYFQSRRHCLCRACFLMFDAIKQ